jgi:hypothetical protein
MEDQVTNVDGSFMDVAIMITLNALCVAGRLDQDVASDLFHGVEFKLSCLVCLAFFIHLQSWRLPHDVSGKDSF